MSGLEAQVCGCRDLQEISVFPEEQQQLLDNHTALGGQQQASDWTVIFNLRNSVMTKRCCLCWLMPSLAVAKVFLVGWSNRSTISGCEQAQQLLFLLCNCTSLPLHQGFKGKCRKTLVLSALFCDSDTSSFIYRRKIEGVVVSKMMCVIKLFWISPLPSGARGLHADHTEHYEKNNAELEPTKGKNYDFCPL